MSPTSDPEPPAETLSFPIVGIGASAGGLDAITELLAPLTADCGMALLIVQHLDPSRPSLLADILSKRARLPVVEAAEGMRVETGHVYVIPPNTSMTLVQGHLRLKPRHQTIGPPMPTDDLLESLAKAQGPNAVGIILSGNGTDGAIGMQAIKGHGGTTFAQDEGSARFNAMPRAAVGLGAVDLVLPPAAIAQELLRIVRHPMLAASLEGGLQRAGEADDDAFGRLFRQLRSACNVDFSHYKRGTVERRLARRLALYAVDTLPAYLDVVKANPAEAHALCRDLLIRYTEFFRDPEAFEALAETAFARFFAAAEPTTPLRVWVPGCASGEEVYSIGICLAEYMASRSLPNPVQIFGTDVSEEALDTARAGRYIENIARNVSGERLNRFFVREGDHFRVAKSLRDSCTFARHNVAYDTPFSRIDLISCRNLLIYLDPLLQKRVMPAFHFALKREGVLMLGLSETIGGRSDLFSPLEGRRGKLFTKKPVPSRAFAALALPMPKPSASAVRPDSSAPDAADQQADALAREIDRVTLERFAPGCVLCDEDFTVIEFRGDTGAFLAHPPGTPTRQLQRLARPSVVLALTDALREVRASGAAVRKAGLSVEAAGRRLPASIEVVPLLPARTDGRWYLVFFVVEHGAGGGAAAAVPATLGQALRSLLAPRAATAAGGAQALEVDRLNDELRTTREQIGKMLEEHESAIEELKAFEEETLSSNEEFQSTNEELETAKEELQSLNEELSTTNDELRYRHRELTALHGEVTQARDYANALIETSAQPLLVLDDQFRVIRANQAFYATFRTQASETLHATLYALGSGQWEIPALRELLEDVLPQRSQVRDHEISATFPQLGTRTIRVNAARVVWPEQALILITFDDVTERQAVLTRLTSADRQKDEFLAMLAHELRNPLAAMSNSLHLWQHDGADAAIRSRALATMQRQLRNQVRMVDDLLDVSRITRGLVSLHSQRFDFALTVRRCGEALKDALAARGQALSLDLPDGGLVLDGDPARLEQVVSNLLLNASKFTPPQGRIDVALERDGSQAVFTVTDSGIGMTEKFLGEVFNVFVQADTSAGRGHGGLGLGLAIVRRLVELHGGSVDASSPGLGRGSRFVVRLPMPLGAAAAPGDAERGRELAAPTPTPARTAAPATAPRRVLVVDDNADLAQSTASLLELDGHEVRIAADGPSALRDAQEFLPDVVLLDIGLPTLSGYEVCRRLRARPEHRDTVIVAVSGYGDAQSIADARAAGFDDHLTKPADPQRFARVIARRRGEVVGG